MIEIKEVDGVSLPKTFLACGGTRAYRVIGAPSDAVFVWKSSGAITINGGQSDIIVTVIGQSVSGEVNDSTLMVTCNPGPQQSMATLNLTVFGARIESENGHGRVIPYGATQAYRASVVPQGVPNGSAAWDVSANGHLEFEGGADKPRIKVSGIAASEEENDSALTLKYSLDGQTATDSLAITVFCVGIQGSDGGAPGNLIAVGASQTFRAALEPASLSGQVTWKASALLEVTGTNGNTITVSGLRASASTNDTSLSATFAVQGKSAEVTLPLSVFGVSITALDGGTAQTLIPTGTSASYAIEVMPPGLPSLDITVWDISSNLDFAGNADRSTVEIQAITPSAALNASQAKVKCVLAGQTATVAVALTAFQLSIHGRDGAPPIALAAKGATIPYVATLVPEGVVGTSFKWTLPGSLKNTIGEDNILIALAEKVSAGVSVDELSVSAQVGPTIVVATQKVTVFAVQILSAVQAPANPYVALNSTESYRASVTPANALSAPIFTWTGAPGVSIVNADKDCATLRGAQASAALEDSSLTVTVAQNGQTAIDILPVTVFSVSIVGEAALPLLAFHGLSTFSAVVTPEELPGGVLNWVAQNPKITLRTLPNARVEATGNILSAAIGDTGLTATYAVQAQVAQAAKVLSVFGGQITARGGGVAINSIAKDANVDYAVKIVPDGLNAPEISWVPRGAAIQIVGQSDQVAAVIRGVNASNVENDSSLAVDVAFGAQMTTTVIDLSVFSVAIKDEDGVRTPCTVVAKDGTRKYKAVVSPPIAGGTYKWTVTNKLQIVGGIDTQQIVDVQGAVTSLAVNDTRLNVTYTLPNAQVSTGAQDVTVVYIEKIVATVQATPPITARQGNAPANHTFEASEVAAIFDPTKTLVLLRGTFPNVALVATVHPAATPITWAVTRDPIDNPLLYGTPTLVPGGANATGVTPDATGTFFIRAFSDGFGAGAFVAGEPFKILPLILVNASFVSNLSATHPARVTTLFQDADIFRGRTGVFDVARDPTNSAILMKATVQVVSGGADGRRMLDRVFAGWINETTSDHCSPATYEDNSHISIIFVSNAAQATGPNGTFIPGAITPPAFLASPLLDCGRPVRGLGGDSAAMTQSRIASKQPHGGLGELWTIDNVDSPSLPFFRYSVQSLSPLNNVRLTVPFRAALCFWTNLQQVSNETSSPANRQYGAVISYDWSFDHEWNIDNLAETVVVVPHPNPGISNINIPRPTTNAINENMEVRAPTGLGNIARELT